MATVSNSRIITFNTVPDSWECPVCFDAGSGPYAGHTVEVPTGAKVDHIFHASCLGEWLNVHHTCPAGCNFHFREVAQVNPNIEQQQEEPLGNEDVYVQRLFNGFIEWIHHPVATLQNPADHPNANLVAKAAFLSLYGSVFSNLMPSVFGLVGITPQFVFPFGVGAAAALTSRAIFNPIDEGRLPIEFSVEGLHNFLKTRASIAVLFGITFCGTFKSSLDHFPALSLIMATYVATDQVIDYGVSKNWVALETADSIKSAKNTLLSACLMLGPLQGLAPLLMGSIMGLIGYLALAVHQNQPFNN